MSCNIPSKLIANKQYKKAAFQAALAMIAVQ